jgi:hypothetical protein
MNSAALDFAARLMPVDCLGDMLAQQPKGFRGYAASEVAPLKQRERLARMRQRVKRVIRNYGGQHSVAQVGAAPTLGKVVRHCGRATNEPFQRSALCASRRMARLCTRQKGAARLWSEASMVRSGDDVLSNSEFSRQFVIWEYWRPAVYLSPALKPEFDLARIRRHAA